MKKFIVFYHAPIDAISQSSGSTPEEMKEGMKQWMDWAARCGDQLVDMGNPLGAALKILPGGGTETGDKTIAGFSILQANTMDEAVKLLEGHPHLGWNAACEIQIHEFMPLPGS